MLTHQIDSPISPKAPEKKAVLRVPCGKIPNAPTICQFGAIPYLYTMTDEERDKALNEILERIAHIEHVLDNIITTMLDGMITSNFTLNNNDLIKLMNEAKKRRN